MRPQDTITAILARAVAEVPDRSFLDFLGHRFTYAEIERMSTELARGLLELGVEPGQPVATILDNSIDAVAIWFAINKIGAVSAPVNTAFRGEFLRAQLHDCTAQVVVAEADYAERVADIAQELPNLRCLVSRGAFPETSAGVRRARLDELRQFGARPIEYEAKPDELAMLVYTSGTTGASKGCMIPHNATCNLAWGMATSHSYTSSDILWTPLPLFHLNAIGVVTAAMVAKTTVAISPRFSVSRFWEEIERSRATSVHILGSMTSLIAEAPGNEFSRRCYGQLRRVNGSPFPPATAEKWRERFGVPVKSSGHFGMTEASTISSSRYGEVGPPGNCGRVGRDYDVKIFDDNDNELPLGMTGEIVARPNRPNIMFQGYWNRPADTVKAWRNLWFHTGDLGRIDEEGYLYFVDRKKDYIRRRGENISTLEVESVFRLHPAIQDVAVHAVLSPLGEDEVKVTAEIKPGAQVTEEELCRWSIERVPYFAVPLYIEFRACLPRSATGKVLKEQLRREGKTGATWDREAAGLTFPRR